MNIYLNQHDFETGSISCSDYQEHHLIFTILSVHGSDNFIELRRIPPTVNTISVKSDIQIETFVALNCAAPLSTIAVSGKVIVEISDEKHLHSTTSLFLDSQSSLTYMDEDIKFREWESLAKLWIRQRTIREAFPRSLRYLYVDRCDVTNINIANIDLEVLGVHNTPISNWDHLISSTLCVLYFNKISESSYPPLELLTNTRLVALVLNGSTAPTLSITGAQLPPTVKYLEIGIAARIDTVQLLDYAKPNILTPVNASDHMIVKNLLDDRGTEFTAWNHLVTYQNSHRNEYRPSRYRSYQIRMDTEMEAVGISLFRNRLPDVPYDSEDSSTEESVMSESEVNEDQEPLQHAWMTNFNNMFISTLRKFVDDNLNDQERETISIWFTNLAKNAQDVPYSCAEIGAMISMFGDMRDLDFKEIALNILVANSTHCIDRATETLNELFIQWKLWEMKKIDLLFRKRAALVISAVQCEIIEQYVAVKIDHAVSRRVTGAAKAKNEAVEIVLFLKIALSKVFDLVLFAKTMQFDTVSKDLMSNVGITVEECSNTIKEHTRSAVVEHKYFEDIVENDDNLKGAMEAALEDLKSQFLALDEQDLTSEEYHAESKKVLAAIAEKKKDFYEKVYDHVTIDGIDQPL